MPRCFASPLTTGPLGGADLSIPAGMIVGGFVYYAFNRLASGAPSPRRLHLRSRGIKKVT